MLSTAGRRPFSAVSVRPSPPVYNGSSSSISSINNRNDAAEQQQNKLPSSSSLLPSNTFQPPPPPTSSSSSCASQFNSGSSHLPGAQSAAAVLDVSQLTSATTTSARDGATPTSSSSSRVTNTANHGESAYVQELYRQITALGCGALVVTQLHARRLNASLNTETEYMATFSASGRTLVSAPVRASFDTLSGWTITIRELRNILFPIDAQFEARNGITVTIQSTCERIHFGSAVCRQPREWCALSRPRGEVQVDFHEIYPTSQTLGSTATTATMAPPPPAVQSGQGGLGSIRMAPLVSTRPSTASVLGRAPLPASSGGTFAGITPPLALRPAVSGTTVGGGGGVTPRGSLVASSIAASSAATASLCRARSIVLSEFIIDNIPPPGLASVRGVQRAVTCVIRLAHTEHRLPPRRAKVSMSRFQASGTMSSSSSDDDCVGSDEEPRSFGPTRSGLPVSLEPMQAKWRHNVSITIDLPPLLTESTASFAVYWVDATMPTGLGQLLGEGNLPIPIDEIRDDTDGSGSTQSSPNRERIARRLTCCSATDSHGGVSVPNVTVSLVTQVVFQEWRREGAGGRPLSAFPRRVGPIHNSTTSTTDGAVSPARPPSAGPRRTSGPLPPTPTSVRGGVGRGAATVQGIDTEELPTDDFVIADADDDSADDEYDADLSHSQQQRLQRPGRARPSSSLPQRKNGAHVHTNKISNNGIDDNDDGTGGDWIWGSPTELDDFVASFELSLRQTIQQHFDPLSAIMDALDARIGEVESRTQAALSTLLCSAADGTPIVPATAAITNNNNNNNNNNTVELLGAPLSVVVSDSRSHTPVPNNSRPSTAPASAGSSSTRPHSNSGVSPLLPPSSTIGSLTAGQPQHTAPHQERSHSPYTPIAIAGAVSHHTTATASASRPGSGDNFIAHRHLPEHNHPLYNDAMLRTEFSKYDTAGSGFITRAQWVHFYRTHNSFAVDETNDDVESELRRFSRRFDQDQITFDEFCVVALRLAKC